MSCKNFIDLLKKFNLQDRLDWTNFQKNLLTLSENQNLDQIKENIEKTRQEIKNLLSERRLINLKITDCEKEMKKLYEEYGKFIFPECSECGIPCENDKYCSDCW
jgi:hypothetical protein